jgi:hypothetical protein
MINSVASPDPGANQKKTQHTLKGAPKQNPRAMSPDGIKYEEENQKAQRKDRLQHNRKGPGLPRYERRLTPRANRIIFLK